MTRVDRPALTRRTAIAAAAALPAVAGAATLLPGEVLAQAPATPAPNGFFRAKVGEMDVTMLFEGVNRRPNPGEGFVRNATADQVTGALRDAFLPTAHLDIPFTVPVVKTGNALVFFDTGTGGQLSPTAQEGARNRAAAGIDPAAVTHVVITHFHGDHISGLTTAENAPVFPNARVFVPEPEWAFWMDDAAMSRAPQGMQGAFQLARRKFGPYQGKIERFAPGAEIAPGITSIAAHGHTPGHTVFRLSSGSAQMLILADTTNVPSLFARNPDWQVSFDSDGPAAAAVRRRLFDMAAADRIPVAGYHFPFPAFGHVRAVGNGFDFVPAHWTTIL